MEENVIYSNSSSVGSDYFRYKEALKLTNNQPVSKSFALDKEEFDLFLVREVLSQHNVGNKCFVAIEHESVIEVARLEDGSNAEVFYKFIAYINNETIDCIEVIKEALTEYITKTYEEVKGYKAGITEAMKQLKCITYSYIYKRTYTKLKQNGNVSKQIKEAIAKLEKQGALTNASNLLYIKQNIYQIKGD